MASYGKYMSLKKGKGGSLDLEKKELEYIHNKREDSIRLANEERVKEQNRILLQKQRQLDSANKTLSASEQEKQSVSLALKKTQTDLTLEKENAQDKEKKLTLSEEEKALQATDLQLKESKLQLQQSELQLQQNKLELQKNELHKKDEVLGLQRTYISIGLAGIIILACFSFFIIRERKKAIQQKLRAERSEKFKQEFIANISHEIRTPMNAINGITRIMLHKDPRPDQGNYLNAINKSADVLLHVINDVLDLSKI